MNWIKETEAKPPLKENPEHWEKFGGVTNDVVGIIGGDLCICRYYHNLDIWRTPMIGGDARPDYWLLLPPKT